MQSTKSAFYYLSRLGNIFTIQIGSFNCVMLNGYDLISEAHLTHHKSLLGRPKYFVLEKKHYSDIIITIWQQVEGTARFLTVSLA